MSDPSLAMLIADRLNWLFANICKDGGVPYIHQEVEDGTALLGHRVTTTTISQLRNGKTPNPGVLTLRAIAAFFGVEPWFLTSAKLGVEELELVKQRAVPADPVTSEIMLRASQVDEESRQALLSMLRKIAQKEAAKEASPESPGTP